VYPVCRDALFYSLARNTACLWDPDYEFWYRAACDAQADTLSVTLYADSACRKKAKRRALHCGCVLLRPGLPQTA
jgi:hypothetical protein